MQECLFTANLLERRAMRKLFFYLKNLLYKLFWKHNLLDAKGIVCYICGTEALPLPLDPAEERMLAQRAENGPEFAAQTWA